MPYPAARAATGAAICWASGTLMARPLFSQMKTTGNRPTPAMFMASWAAPSDAAPSPNQHTATGVLAEDPGGVGGTDGVGEVGADLARHRADTEPAAREMGAQLPAAGVRIGRPAEGAEEDLVGCHPRARPTPRSR